MADRTGRVVQWIARRRVPIGFVCGAIALWLGRPSRLSLATGAVVAAIGEGLRIWAAGHLDKGREVTASGPYRWFAHPLYVGSSVLGLGFAIAARSLVVALLVAIYLGVTLTAAVRTEEARLRELFGEQYDKYKRGQRGAASSSRPFRAAQVFVNNEHRAVTGVVLVWLLLLAKATYNDAFG